MRAEPCTTRVACSADPSGGRLRLSARVVPEILFASSTGVAAGGEVVPTLRRVVIDHDVRIDTDARSFATWIRNGSDTVVKGHIASALSATGHLAIAAPNPITSSARSPSIDPDHLRSTELARHPRRLTDRQLTLTD